jgi:hypothetical protein
MSLFVDCRYLSQSFLDNLLQNCRRLIGSKRGYRLLRSLQICGLNREWHIARLADLELGDDSPNQRNE